MKGCLAFLLIIIPFCLKAQVDIIAAEYYIDNDPGIGSGTPISITSGATINTSFMASTSALAEGFHMLVIRVQDMNTDWSVQESRAFYVSASALTTQANIVAMEYYLDTDPGTGSGVSIPIVPSTNQDVTTTIPTSSLTAGFHSLTIRTLDSDGFWSVQESRGFYVSQSQLSALANIVAMEYYIDADPGYGNGSSISLTAGTSINTTTTIATASLSSGYHVLHIRALDSDGVWGETESRSFYIDAFSGSLIAGVEYFYDTDPGYGNGSTLAIVPPVSSIDSTLSFPASSLSVGAHELGMRMLMDNGTLGITDYFPITICDVAIADFVPDVVCVGNTTTFTDASTGVLGGDVYSWDFDADGFEDSNTQGDQSFTFTADGTYNATLSIDRAGCVSTITVQVQVEPLPMADAGADQSICNTSANMAANAPSANETGTWTVFSGTATITNPTNEATTITDISTNSVELVWTLTNSLGGCTDSDTVQLSANLPITAAAQNSTVDIGQTINMDVQSSATINIGDVLNTTITTQPTQGIAQVLANGTIDYTPDPDATSSDSFVYRITNQCSNFDENTVSITIVNLPPVIDNSGFSVSPNAQQVSFDLTSLISDPNNNLDFSTLSIITQPKSGAIASIDANGILMINYAGITYSGDDELEIQICDLVGECTTQLIIIPGVEVGGENPPLKVFNGVSPNGDGYHDFLEIENIEYYPNNTVIILNRWGGEVARYHGYNNQDIVFNDATLPSGTYYYQILPEVEGAQNLTGYFLLKIDN